MRVLIVSPCDLPIPAVKGGAVATLIESLVIQNQIHNQMDLTIVSSFDSQAMEKAKRYARTSFLFLKQTRFTTLADSLLDYFVKKITKTNESKQYLRKLSIIRQLHKILKNNNYDRVVFQNSGYLLTVLRDKAIRKKYKDKLYYHLHNDIPDNVYISGVLSCELLLISEYLSKKAVELCGPSIKKNIHIVKNGFDCEHFMQELPLKEKEQLKKKLGISPEKKIILFAGRIVEYKGIGELLDAFTELERNDLILLIVGSHNFGSSETSAFEKSIKAKFAHLQNKVIFTGYVPYENMWKYYKLADAAVFPSMWEEPAGLVMIEAAASGIPVITTRSGGIPEYLDDTHAILLEKDKNLISNIKIAISKVLDHPSEWAEKSPKTTSYVKEHYSEYAFYTSFVKAITKK